MESGFFFPLNIRFQILWIWWVILVAFQQTLYYEAGAKWNTFTIILFIIAIVILYYLIRQRRFFASHHHLYFTLDFRLKMMPINFDYMTAVEFSRFRMKFAYAGKYYDFLIIGSSRRLMESVLESNQVIQPEKLEKHDKKD